MARKANLFPSYLLHQPTGQARVRIAGKDHYLGEYGSEASRIAYGQLVAKLAGGVHVDPFVKAKRGSTTTIEPEAGLTINELVLAFMRHADGHYVKNGKPTSEIHCMKSATRPLIDVYGFTAVDSFGPMMLKAVRQRYVDAGWVRDTCNKGVKRIRTIFKWGVENEMLAPATLQGLQAVAPLLAGRTVAKDNPDRLPATDEQIKAVKPHVSQLVKDLIDVQRFTGARAGELLLLTPEKNRHIRQSLAIPCGRSQNRTPWSHSCDCHRLAGSSRPESQDEEAEADRSYLQDSQGQLYAIGPTGMREGRDQTLDASPITSCNGKSGP